MEENQVIVDLSREQIQGLLRLLEVSNRDTEFHPDPEWNLKHAEIILRDAIHAEALMNPNPDGYPHG